jgi:hypothetical protein
LESRRRHRVDCFRGAAGIVVAALAFAGCAVPSATYSQPLEGDFQTRLWPGNPFEHGFAQAKTISTAAPT